MSRFLEALHSGQVLLMDGAMGTELQRAGIKEGECYELWNLTHPDRVRAIHRSYVYAGARCLLTNTFQANPTALAGHGLQGRLEEINREAIALARSVGVNHFVLADVGPGEKDKDPFGRMMRSLCTADAFLLETWSAPPLPLFQSIFAPDHDWWRSWNLYQVPVLLSLTCSWELRHRNFIKGIAGWAGRVGIAALGVNCGRDIGMDEVIEIIRLYRQVTDLPLFARPNAGTPTRVDGRWVYPHTPAAMAGRLPELLEAGVSMVGGCCGTTPDHIAAFRLVIEDWNRRRKPGRAAP